MTIRPTQVKTRTSALDVREVTRAGDERDGAIARCNRTAKPSSLWFFPMSFEMTPHAAFFITRAVFEISTSVGIIALWVAATLIAALRASIGHLGESRLESNGQLWRYSNFERADLSLLLYLGKNLIIHISGAYSRCHCPRLTARPRVLTPACTRCHLSAKTGARSSERQDRFLSWFLSLFPASREKKRVHRLASRLPEVIDYSGCSSSLLDWSGSLV
jgi:hypothetical protein